MPATTAAAPAQGPRAAGSGPGETGAQDRPADHRRTGAGAQPARGRPAQAVFHGRQGPAADQAGRGTGRAGRTRAQARGRYSRR